MRPPIKWQGYGVLTSNWLYPVCGPDQAGPLHELIGENTL